MARGRTVLRVALVIAVVLVGVALYWKRSTQPEQLAAPATAMERVDEPQLDVAATPASHRENVTAVPAPVAVVETPVTPAQVFRGRVLLKEDSSPLAGAVVMISLAQGGTWLDTQTDAQGAFRFELDKPNSVRSLRVPATPTTTALLAWANEAFPAGPSTERTFYVTRGATVSGVVVDRSGAPVAGANVFGWCAESYPGETRPDRTATSDSSGRFALESLGESFYVAASARDLCCARGLRGKLVPGTHAEGLQVVVAPCVSLRGRVVDDAGFALAGATMRIDGASSTSSSDNTSVPGVTGCDWGSAKVTCAPDGSFEITGLAGPHLRLQAWCEHETCIGEHLHIDSDLADNRLVLKRGVDVSGIVRLHDGAPAANAAVTLGHVGGRSRKVTTRADGTVTARGVSPDPKAIVRVRLRGAAIHSSNAVIEPGGVPLEIRLEPARALAGVVLDEARQPVPFAKVRIEGDRLVDYSGVGFGEPTTLEFSHTMNRATADAAGRFRFDDLYDGTFEVRATDAAGTSAQGKVTSRSGVEDLVVAFDASQTVVLAGRVVDDATGEPIREFSLTCMKPDKGRKGSWSGTTKKFNAADGSFRYGGIEPGQVELSVDADGYARLSFGKQDYAAGTHELEARLAQARTLSIQVERADGRPFQNGNLTVTDAQGRRLGMNFGTGTTTSIDVGREPVHLAGLPARLVTIHVEHENETFDFDFDLRAPIVGTQTVIVKPKPEPPEVGLAVIVIDSRVNAPGDEPPYIRDAWELDLEDAQGRRLSRIDVKPAEKGFDIRTRTGSNASHATRAEPVAELRVRTTVATGKLRIGTAAPIVLTVPAPDPDGRILWVVDVSKL